MKLANHNNANSLNLSKFLHHSFVLYPISLNKIPLFNCKITLICIIMQNKNVIQDLKLIPAIHVVLLAKYSFFNIFYKYWHYKHIVPPYCSQMKLQTIECIVASWINKFIHASHFPLSHRVLYALIERWSS